MPFAVITTFIALCISAPWISRSWGWRGEIAWAIATFVFAITAILLLD